MYKYFIDYKSCRSLPEKVKLLSDYLSIYKVPSSSLNGNLFFSITDGSQVKPVNVSYLLLLDNTEMIITLRRLIWK